jgi:hypothetical protein
VALPEPERKTGVRAEARVSVQLRPAIALKVVEDAGFRVTQRNARLRAPAS